MINSKYFWAVWRWVLDEIGITFLGNLHVSQKYMQKIPSTKIRTWGITSMKNYSSAHQFLSSVWNYVLVKTRIISKPLKWFPKRINWLVSIWSDFNEKYFQTDYNILWVQVDVHCPLVSQVIILEWKCFVFFTRSTGNVRWNV